MQHRSALARFWYGVVALWVGCAVATAAEPASQTANQPASRPPNIVFILADDLGYTDIGPYGTRYYETPHLDQLAKEGTRFTAGYSCGPNCQPTRAALLSGQYAARTGIYTVGNIDRFDWRTRSLRPAENVVQLPLEKKTIAQTLQSAGYVTGLFGKWHLGKDSAHHPSRRGFTEAIESSGKHFDFVTDPPVEHPKGQYLADFLTDRAVDFIQRHKDQPFFLYVPHYGVHGPHDAKPEWVAHFKDKPPAGGHDSPAYAAMIASVDESVGRIVKTLDDLKLSDNTLVIFSSDNGGVGGYTREGLGKDGITDNAPLRGGKGMLYEGGIRVPYLFRWPGRIRAGAVNDTPINSVDLYPSLLAFTHTAPPSDYPLDGESYAPLLLDPDHAKPARDSLFWHFPGYLGQGKGKWRTLPVSVIRQGDWKLLEFLEDGRLELYNLKEDLSEKTNLAASDPDRAKALHERLKTWREQIKAPLPTAITPEDIASAKVKKNRKQDNDD